MGFHCNGLQQSEVFCGFNFNLPERTNSCCGQQKQKIIKYLQNYRLFIEGITNTIRSMSLLMLWLEFTTNLCRSIQNI